MMVLSCFCLATPKLFTFIILSGFWIIFCPEHGHGSIMTLNSQALNVSCGTEKSPHFHSDFCHGYRTVN